MTDASVSIPVDGGDMGAYVSRPEQSNGGAVVVLQEIFGVNDTIRGFADKFSAAGFLAVHLTSFGARSGMFRSIPARRGGMNARRS
ncbi:Dienelactone hydrolase (plasmid) [Phaeobacter gallaeciensis]|nr:Dienelactone hydrolase [Phaeobacter gallaeciensis]ATF24710.1 Dienelactone hydrolase [Phaeobacter gallaeciensis]